ncbi:MAG: glycosyltransferase [Bernardetiaceae bacterium]|jgi:glycosyltransferase involved in cell wall biosynthesis|nr:glycosyltransferase [Bernardetiaceae bacterium]
MRVLHLCTHANGGAAKACIRLHQGLARLGVDSKILFLHPPRTAVPQSLAYQPAVADPNYPGWRTRLQYHWRRLWPSAPFTGPIPIEDYLRKPPAGQERFSLATSPFAVHQQAAFAWAQVVHLHWVAGLVDYPGFFGAAPPPVVWTLHDQNPFTGGCHYSQGCLKFQADCAHCPQLAPTTAPELAAKQLEIKQKALAGATGPTVVCPSRWLMHLSRSSRLFAAYRHHHIANGVDTQVFSPFDKRRAKRRFGLPDDRPVVLFAADYTGSLRKGFAYLRQAASHLAQLPITWAVATNDGQHLPAPFRWLGAIKQEAEMAAAYNAADLVVVPSLEDNLPNAVVEALCCGVPVAGFATGGLPEMIEDGINGYLCPEISGGALARTLQHALAQLPHLATDQIRQRAVAQYNLPQQAARYLALYQQLLP